MGRPVRLLSRHLCPYLYIAIGEPGLIEVFDTESLERVEMVTTEPGAHTPGFDSRRQKVYVFLPRSHRAVVYQDRPS